MKKSNIPPNNSLNKQDKDKEFKDQFSKVYKGFFEQPQSMKMLSVKLNIDRANICWYCRDLRKNNRLGIAKKGICSITKQVVNFYTTNPELIQSTNQTKLFE
jgi:hypothetical protein